MRTHVDLPTLEALQAEWRTHPPVHHLVAAYLKYEPPQDNPSIVDAQDMQDLMSRMPRVSNAPALDTGAWDSFAQAPQEPSP